MNLLVISHTPHIKTDKGYFGWGPTVNELNFISPYFKQVTHIAPVDLEPGTPPSSYVQVSRAVRLVPTVNRGGQGARAKMKVLFDSYQYWRLIRKNIDQADLIHVRCPANVSLIALLLLIFYPRKRKWIKYAGDWRRRNDPLSYRLQRSISRRWLSNHFVTINSFPDGEPSFIYHFNNPSFLDAELAEAARISEEKKLSPDAWVSLFVGGLTPNKGPDIVIEGMKGIPATYPGRLHLIGDGEMREELQNKIDQAGLQRSVCLEGWQNKDNLKAFYHRAHFILLPSKGEGWPKVISEAMAFGVVPIVSRVSDLERMLKQFNTGVTVESYDPAFYRDAVMAYLCEPDRWKTESIHAMKAAGNFSLENWWSRLSDLIEKH